jgi:hypothetical protein
VRRAYLRMRLTKEAAALPAFRRSLQVVARASICLGLADEGADVVVGAMQDMNSAERTAEQVRRLGSWSFGSDRVALG